MLEFLRRQSKPIMIAVTTIIVIAFVFWSGNTRRHDGAHARPEDIALRVGGRDVSYLDASKLQHSYVLSRQLGLPGVGMEGLFRQGGFGNELIGSSFRHGDASTMMPLIYEDVPVDYCLNLLVLRGAMEEHGIRVTDEEAREYFRKLPAFNTNGQLDPDTVRDFLRMIGSRGQGEEDVYTLLRDVIGFQRLYQIVAGNVVCNPATAEKYYAAYFSTVKAASIPFALEDYKKKVQLTDKAVTDYYEEHKASYKSDEKRAITLIVFPRPDTKGKDAEGTVKAEREYDALVQKFSEAVLKPDVKFEEEAKATKIAEIKTIPLFTASAPPEELKEENELISAVFANDPKRLPISDPLTLKKGYAFFKVTTIEEPKQLELKDVDAKVREILTAREASLAMNKAANEARTKLEASLKAGKKFEDAVKEAGLTSQNVAEFSVANPPPDIAVGFKFGTAAQFTPPGSLAKDIIESENGLLLLYVISKELRKTEESAATKVRVVATLDTLARQDVFRAWFDKAVTSADIRADKLLQSALNQSR